MQVQEWISRKNLRKTRYILIGIIMFSSRLKMTGMRTWSWPSGWCIGLRSWLRGFDAQLGHLHDACTSLLQKSKLQLSGLK